MAEALYEIDGDRAVPTDLTRGPWDGDAQHGGPVAALLARAVEEALGDEQVARLTIELLRPVPLRPLTVSTAEVRPGRRIRLVGVEVNHDGVAVARATALLIRRAEVSLPPSPADAAPGSSPDDGTPADWGRVPWDGYHTDAVEIRFTRSGFPIPGPSFAWIRLRVPVAAGEEPGPVQRVAAAADFGNGVSAFLHPREHVYINPDLTIYLHRRLHGDWVGLDAASFAGEQGAGMAESALYDPAGRIGRSVQALYIAPRA